MKVVGIDLAGKAENPTGFCVLTENGTETKLLYSDEEILKEVEEAEPECIAIDAPFWMPQFGLWRPCDEKLIRRGFQPVSSVFPMMRLLVSRASKIVRILNEKKYKVVEAFSPASESMLGLSKEPRKNKDEYEALLCALTAKSYLEGNYENLDGIILPK